MAGSDCAGIGRPFTPFTWCKPYSRSLQVVAVGEHHAAFTQGYHFTSLKAERARVLDGAHAAAPPLAAVRMCAVADERDPMLVNESPQSIHVGGHSPIMDAHDRPGLGRNRVSDLAGVDVIRTGIDVNKHWRGANGDYCRGHSYPRSRRNDDFIAGLDAYCLQGQFHAYRPGGHRHAVPCVLKRSKGLFKSPHPRLFPLKLRTCPGPALQHVMQCPLVAFIVHRPGYPQRRINERRSTGQG